MHLNSNTKASQVNSYPKKYISARVYSLEEKQRWAKVKEPHYRWARNNSLKHKHSSGLTLWLNTLVTISNEKGICNVGMQSAINKHFYRHGVRVPLSTAEKYTATLKKQKLINKYELKTQYSLSNSTVKRRYKTYATRLLLGRPSEKEYIIYPPKDIYIGEGVVAPIQHPSNTNIEQKGGSLLGAEPPMSEEEKKIKMKEQAAQFKIMISNLNLGKKGPKYANN